jgi:hypothetical protein
MKMQEMLTWRMIMMRPSGPTQPRPGHHSCCPRPCQVQGPRLINSSLYRHMFPYRRHLLSTCVTTVFELSSPEHHGNTDEQ